MRICNVCEIEKPLSEFYVNKQCVGGYQKRCKECSKKASKNQLSKIKADPDLYEKEQKRHRDKYHRLGYREKHKPTSDQKKKQIDKYKAIYPEKYIAKNCSYHLVKPFDNAEAHHWSYNEPHYKDVIWLSTKQHAKIHRFIIYDQERKMYRQHDTNELLDTKEAHEKFIHWCIENKED